jgi:hypothetical protein
MGLESVADPEKTWYSASVDDSKKSFRSSFNGLTFPDYTKKATTWGGAAFFVQAIGTATEKWYNNPSGKILEIGGGFGSLLRLTSKKSISIGEASQRKKTFVTSVFSDGFFPAQWYNENRRRRDHLTTSEKGICYGCPFPLIATYYKSSIERKRAEKVA